MAITTVTTTVYNQSPRAVHVGLNYAVGSYVASGRTLSDIILLCRIPNGATIVDFDVAGTSGETVSVFKLGIKSAGTPAALGGGTAGAGTETTFGTGSFSTGAKVHFKYGVHPNALNGAPYRVSISDTDAQAGADVYMTLSVGSWTTSVSFDFMFAYVMPGQGIS
jgi:hypothetical protein